MVNVIEKATSKLDPKKCVIFPESIVTTDVLIKMASRDKDIEEGLGVGE